MSKIYEKYLINENELVARIIEWNKVRNGLEFNPVLEIRMLSEEVIEALEATNLQRYTVTLCAPHSSTIRA